MDRNWKLGDDLATSDSLLDGITFDDLILAVHCNCRRITPDAVKRELKDMMESRMEDLNYLLEHNMSEIIAEAENGRGEYGVKIGKRCATFPDNKNEGDELRQYKEKYRMSLNRITVLEMELSDARTANGKMYQRNFSEGYHIGVHAAINHIMKELKMHGNLEITESGADTDAMCDAAAEKIRAALLQECDCDRIEQLCQQLEQVSKERDDALETLHRVRDSLDYATKHD